MTHSYSQSSLMVLAFLGILSAIMFILSVILIFQLQMQQAVIKKSLSFMSSEITAVLMPVSPVLSVLSLTLNLSSVVVCLLNSYFTSEMCREEQDTQRADWFLLDSRAVRHVATGLFCLGVLVYLAAMSIYMLLVFEIETGIASMCVLSSGVLILLLIIIHCLIRAAHTAKHFRDEQAHTMYQNYPESSAGIRTSNLSLTDNPWRQHGLASLHRHFSNIEQNTKQKTQYPPSNGPHIHSSYSGDGSGQTHQTLSTESGLFHAQVNPWNGVNSEMRSVLARKATVKDSTLV